jgi:two-component system NtrC family sensor kinase
MPGSERSAIGLLKLLLVASLLLPAALFALVAWYDYRATLEDARGELLRTSEVAREQAAKVFDAQSQAADQVNDLVHTLNDAEIRRSEAALHDAFARIVARLPQVQSVLLVSRDGHPLVSAGVYPVPGNIDLRSHDYVRAVLGGYRGTYVSSLQIGDVNRQMFFGLARPWIGPDGQVAGVIDVAVQPSFFEEFYHALINEAQGAATGRVLTLVRADGQLLVRYPPLPMPMPVAPPKAPFFQAIRSNPDAGTYTSVSVLDAETARVFAYHRVLGYPLYVVAGRSKAAIVAGWEATMADHLLFAVPATLAMFALTWTALVRTRREEQALSRAQAEMARREAAEAALLRAQRLEAVGQMTGGVAHDFNNLLTVIVGSAEMLGKRAEDPARVRRIAQQILLAAKRGSEITQQLLTFSRRQSMRPETINLNRCLKDFEQLLHHAAGGQGQIRLHLDAGLDPVRLDPGHFEAAILNLVGNARDAMPEGGKIDITTCNVTLSDAEHAELPAGAYVRVCVADQGSGMDATTAAKAFEPFFTTKDVGRGTGLGLSQVYGFAKQAGGDVRILTAPGAGTTVELLLPRTHGREAVERPAIDAIPLRPASSGEVVLVVEDEPDVLAMAAENLRDLGYIVTTAPTAQAALDLLSAPGRCDVMFCDVVMPGGMSGLQLAVEARRLRPDLKVLLTSGYTGSADKGPPHDLPLLAKPYNRNQLANHLRAVLQK